MTCYTTDWGKLLSPNSIIRPDVTFLVSDDVNLRNKIRGMESVVGNIKEIKAHIIVLAAVSPVFESQFFGEGWKKEESVPVKGSNIKAFETFLDIIYKKDRDNWGLDQKSLYILFEVLHLADMYGMKEIVDIITKEIGEVKITRDNVMEAAAIAEYYKLYEEASKALFKRCGATMNNILKTKDDIINFLDDDSEDEVDLLLFKRILVSMKEPKRDKPRCTTCNKLKKNCMDGKDVTPGNVVCGKHVVSKSGSGTHYHGVFTESKPGELVEYSYDTVWIKTAGGPVTYYYLDHGGVSQFMFKCK